MRKEEFYQLPKLIQQYLIYLEAIKGHSELSVIEYASDLRTFLDTFANLRDYIQRIRLMKKLTSPLLIWLLYRV